eukprot:5440713-Alexandrium_andersonii.AAC.1
MAKCGGRMKLVPKPVPSLGKWPKVWCPRCARARRTGRAVCVICRQHLQWCRCGEAGSSVKRQTTLFDAFARSSRGRVELQEELPESSATP